MYRSLLILCFLLISSFVLVKNPAIAFMQVELTDEDLSQLIEDWKPLEVTGDAIAWDVFGQTTEIEECIIDEEGYDYCIVKPNYSEAIQQLDGTKVTLMGFMFPLEQTEKQHNFLLGPYPTSCPFHYHVGPSLVVEVVAAKPVSFSYEPVTLKGTLSVQFNEETGVFFYLNDAKST